MTVFPDKVCAKLSKKDSTTVIPECMTRPRSSWTRRMLTAYLSSPPPPSTHHDPWPPQPGHHDPATHHCRQGGTIRRVEKSNFPSFQVELDEGSMTLDAADWLASLKHLFIYRSSIPPAFPSELNKILSGLRATFDTF